MWRNRSYNELAHQDQWRTIIRHLPVSRGDILDLGCGTGRLSRELSSLFHHYTGVDLDTMVEEAGRRNADLRVDYIPASVQDYNFPRERFDLVLSMACLASACQAEELATVSPQIVDSIRPGGRLIMIDPFHRLPILVRTCRLHSREVISLFQKQGMALIEWSGIHCIPVRLVMARAFFSNSPRLTRQLYTLGERMNRLAPRRLGDYQVIVLEKRPPCISG